MKIKIVKPRYPKKHPKTNSYLTAYGWMSCYSYYDFNDNEILIVKQNALLLTSYLLLHELGHWLIGKIFGSAKIAISINRLYDIIDGRIIKLSK